MAQTTPLATPRTRVGKISAVSTVLGPQKPRKPKLHARPKIHSSKWLLVKIQAVRKTAPSSRRGMKADPPGRPPAEPQAKESPDAPADIEGAVFRRRPAFLGRQVERHPGAHGAEDAGAAAGDEQRDQGRGQDVGH